MRRTVRSVAGSPGLGPFCVNLSITVALAQTGSDRSPSMVGASDASMRTAIALGLTSVVGTVGAGCADANPLNAAHKSRAGAALAPQLPKTGLTFPPGRFVRPMFLLACCGEDKAEFGNTQHAR